MVSGSAASGSRPSVRHQAVELPPGGAVGAAGAVAAGAGGVDRGAAGQLLDLGGAGGAVGHGERAEQGGLQDQGACHRRAGGAVAPGGGGVAARARAGGRPWRGRVGGTVSGRAGADDRRPAGSRSGESVMAARLERLFSVRKAGLSDGTLSSRSRASVSGRTAARENTTKSRTDLARIGADRPCCPNEINRLGETPRWPADTRVSPTGRRCTTVLRPAWEDTPDETDADRRGTARGRRPAATTAASPDAWLPGTELPRLLGPLCAATDALARLDARAAAAADAVRDGLIARMAFAEAAGWLAHAHAWVHPLDLSLRALGPHRQHRARRGRAPVTAALPQTFAGPAEPSRLGRSAVRRDGRRRPRHRRGAGTRPPAAPAGRQTPARPSFASATASGRDARRRSAPAG